MMGRPGRTGAAIAALLLSLVLCAPLGVAAQQAAQPAPVAPSPPASAPQAQPAPAAQQPQAAQAPKAPPAQPSAAMAAQRAKLDSVRLQLDQIEAAVQRTGQTDASLAGLRDQLLPLGETARTVVSDLTPRADAIRQRLAELGPKPGENDPPESADVGREREDRQGALNDIDETVRLARTLLVQAEQTDKEITDRRRDLFTQRLFESSSSLLAPDLWADIVSNFPQDLRALMQVAADTASRMGQRVTWPIGAGLVASLLLALFLVIPVRRFALGFVKRDRLAGHPSRLQRSNAAASITLLGAIAPALASMLLIKIVDATDLFPARVEPAFARLIWGAAFVAFIRSLADAVLAPDRMNWRLFNISDDRARNLVNLATLAAMVLVLGRTVEAVYQSIAAGIRLSVATQGIFAIIVALVIARALNMIRWVDDCDEAAFGPHVSDTPDLTAPVRFAGWVLCAVVIGAVLAGYVAFASFLVSQMAWAAIVLTALMILLALSDEWCAVGFAPNGRLARLALAGIGLSRHSLEQIGVLTSGVLKVILFALAATLLLAPWGIESTDLLSSIRAAFFGISVGGVTVSLGTILLGAFVFLLGVVITRTVQRWLRTKYLPHTQLDAGLKDSITTGLGYLGFVLAAVLAASYVGLSLDKFTIVAGALSVGIGFGLQSIVNNFVSGLILLAERSIRVGDWIVVGGEQGYVKRINVRATEVETFDRATLIVPNSTLVSGSVKNWVHSDRTGRVLVTVPVGRYTDADQVATVLKEVAAGHEDVLEDPPPRVLFRSMTESTLTFDLICFVGEVDTAARVSSDLTFEIFRRLRDSGLVVAPGTPEYRISGLDTLQERLVEIGAKLETRPKAGKGGNGKDQPAP
jgi:small-conductance mechanosensitive channel